MINPIVFEGSYAPLQVADVQTFMIVVKGHDEWYVLHTQVVAFTEYIDETFTHVAINPALYGVVCWWHTALYLEIISFHDY